MGPAESSSNRTSGAWRLLIWGPLVILAIASGFVSPSSWGGLVALWGRAPLVAGLAAVWAVVGLRGYREWKDHTDRLESIPIRIHVDGSRGKTGTCRLIGAALRAKGDGPRTSADANREPTGTEGNRANGQGAERPGDRHRMHGRRSGAPPGLPGHPDPRD